MSSANAWAAFAPTQQELAYVAILFETADPQKLGIITGEAAVPVLAGSNLPPEKLGEIWAMADHDNNGFLTKKGVAVAVRCIAWAQNGEAVTDALLAKPGPLPTITGVKNPLERATSPVLRSPVPASSMPPLTTADRQKYLRLFVNSGPTGGLLSGEKARDIFLKSRLPLDKLGLIWQLADTQNRGALDTTDFAIGMHLIQASMSNPAFVLPSVLPAGAYEQASGGKPLDAQLTGGSFGSNNIHPTSPVATSGIIPQYTGQQQPPAPLRPQGTGSSPLNPQFTGSQRFGSPSPSASAFPSSAFARPQPQQQVWDITPDEKAKADAFFEDLDKTKRGYIEGDVAVPFMLGSKLPEALLAHIWDLSDLSNDGKLTRDGFAVALHLINSKLAGKEVPTALPASLIPPSMRKVGLGGLPQTDTQRDLWDLQEDSPSTPTAGISSPQTIRAPLSPALSGLSPANTGSGALSQMRTGAGSPSALITSPPSRSQFKADFLSDDDESSQPAGVETSNRSPGPSSSLAIGNAKNALESTQRSLATAQTDRAQMESAAAASAAELAQLETQLAAARASHSTETVALAEITARQQAQLGTVSTTRQELITAESALSALRAEKAEVQRAVLDAKEEIRGIQRQLAEATEQSNATKAELESLKKDSRQQKGLLAIAKKQLAGAEETRERVRKEVQAEKEELERATAELAQTHAATEALTAEEEAVAAPLAAPAPPAETFAPNTNVGALGSIELPEAGVALPMTPDVQSPALSTKSNNPFGRLQQNSLPGSPAPFSPFGLPGESSTPNVPSSPKSTTPHQAPAGSFDDAFGISEEAGPPLTVTTAFSKTPEDPEASIDPFGAADSTDGHAQLSDGQERASSPAVITPTALSPEEVITPKAALASSSPPPGLGNIQTSLEASNNSIKPNVPAIATSAPVADRFGAHEEELAPIKDLELDDDSSDDEDVETARPAAKTTPDGLHASVFSETPTSTPAVASPTLEEPSAINGTNAFSSTFPPVDESKTVPSIDSTTATPSASAFDNAFGLSKDASVSPTASPSTSGFSSMLPPPPTKSGSARHSMMPFATPDTRPSVSPSLFTDSFAHTPFPSKDQPQRAASTAELDDAFGTKGGPVTNGAKPVAFESSFDDTFDFGGAPSTSVPASVSQPAAAAAPAAPSSPWPSTSAASNGTMPSSPTPAIQPKYSPPSSAPPPQNGVSTNSIDSYRPINFDDAFGTSTEIPAFTPTAPATAASPAAPSLPPRARQVRSPSEDSDNRPLSSFVGRSMTTRQRSPSPQLRSRMSISPPPAVSGSGKAKNSNEPTGSRTSKISLHFPFGKNKNKNKAEKVSSSGKKGGSTEPASVDEHGGYRPPPRSMSPVPTAQDVIGGAGPNDDVAAVKTLVNMGFTREQAVNALEQNSYDVPTALNKLLGAP